MIAVIVALSAMVAATSAFTNGWGNAGVAQHSGYITVDGTYKNGSHMFFWLFESQSKPSSDPLVLWLTGGV
jgi:carboxypeptidase C (cathepsin A)